MEVVTWVVLATMVVGVAGGNRGRGYKTLDEREMVATG